MDGSQILGKGRPRISGSRRRDTGWIAFVVIVLAAVSPVLSSPPLSPVLSEEKRPVEEGEPALDPLVIRLVELLSRTYRLDEPPKVRLGSPLKIEAVLAARRPPVADRSAMQRLLAVLGIPTDLGPLRPPEGQDSGGPGPAGDARREWPRPVAGYEPSGGSEDATEAGVLWVREGALDLSDLLAVSREAARGCRLSISADQVTDRLGAGQPPEMPASLGSVDGMTAVQATMGDQALARTIARDAEAHYFADQALLALRFAIAKREHLPPWPHDGWRTKEWRTRKRAAWRLAHERFAVGPGRAYIVRKLDAVRPGGDHRGFAFLDRPPSSTAALIHGSGVDPALPSAPASRASTCGLPVLLVGEAGSEFVLGELRTELVLRLAADPLRAIRASRGWVDDRIRWVDTQGVSPVRSPSPAAEPAQDPAPGMVLWSVEMATEDDARELVDALRKLLERRFAGFDDPRPETFRDRDDLAWCGAAVNDQVFAAAGRDRVTVRFAISVDRPLPEWARGWTGAPLAAGE